MENKIQEIVVSFSLHLGDYFFHCVQFGDAYILRSHGGENTALCFYKTASKLLF